MKSSVHPLYSKSQTRLGDVRPHLINKQTTVSYGRFSPPMGQQVMGRTRTVGQEDSISGPVLTGQVCNKHKNSRVGTVAE